MSSKAKTSPDLQAGKVAVVTGAGSGIGRALSIALAARGMHLALVDRDPASLAETAALAGPSVGVLTACFDVSQEAPNYEFAARVLERFGHVDLVVNNAGVAIAGSVYELSSEEIGWIMGVNFWGVVHGTKAYLPALAAQNSGTIVNISSLYGLYGPPLNSAYAASKFAVRGFTESLRGEMSAIDSGVRIVTVHPGGIATNIAKSSRIAAATADPELTLKRREFFDKKALTTTPEEATRVILAGLDAGKERILIARETFVVDFIIRAFGGRGAAFLNASVRKQLPKELRG